MKRNRLVWRKRPPAYAGPTYVCAAHAFLIELGRLSAAQNSSWEARVWVYGPAGGKYSIVRPTRLAAVRDALTSIREMATALLNAVDKVPLK